MSCGPLRATPKKKTMSPATWELAQKKREIRKGFFDYSACRRRGSLRAVFEVWKGNDVSWPFESKEEALGAARDLHQLQEISRQVTKALRMDDLTYFQNVADSMGDVDDPIVGQNIWKKIR